MWLFYLRYLSQGITITTRCMRYGDTNMGLFQFSICFVLFWNVLGSWVIVGWRDHSNNFGISFSQLLGFFIANISMHVLLIFGWDLLESMLISIMDMYLQAHFNSQCVFTSLICKTPYRGWKMVKHSHSIQSFSRETLDFHHTQKCSPTIK